MVKVWVSWLGDAMENLRHIVASDGFSCRTFDSDEKSLELDTKNNQKVIV